MMNIILISSGYKGIYPYLEQTVVDEFLKLGHSIVKINPTLTKELREVIKQSKPEVVITLVGYKTDKQLLNDLRKTGAVLCVWLTEDPFYLDRSIEIMPYFQHVFTIDLAAFEFYKVMFPEKTIMHLPLGTISSIYQPSEEKAKYDLCLTGFPYPGRVELVQRILAETPYSLLVVGPGWRKSIAENDSNRVTIINRWSSPHQIRKVYNQSKIILNPHRDDNFRANQNNLGITSKSINNRCFDIAACGGFQLIPHKPDTDVHFNLEKEIVVYFSPQHCIELIHFFMKNEVERTQYSQNAYKRALNGHTMFHRIQDILNTLFEKK